MDLASIIHLWQLDIPAPPHPVLRDRYLGVLLGTAVGNMLGVPVESLTKSHIQRLFPHGLRSIEPMEQHRPWDDDLAQSALIAEALLKTGELDVADLGIMLSAWRRENGRGIGNLTARVIDAIEDGYPASETAERVWRADGRGPAGNGAVMRCAPVALRWMADPEQLVEQTMRSAQITHYDERCQWSAVALNVALALVLRGITIEEQKLAAALERSGAPEAVVEAILEAERQALAGLELDDPQSMGYTLKTMQVGLWALHHADDFEGRLVEVVNEGGDTDTNGAVAGAVLGAALGNSAIPKDWRQLIPGRGKLERLAYDLLLVTARLK